jgi:excisionase family DNA binding protein
MGAMKKLSKKIMTPTARAGSQSGRGTSSVVPTPSPQSGEGQVPAGEQLLDPKGVGKRMKLSPRTVSEMALEGRLPFFRIGIYQRFKWAEVEKYLEASCRCGPTVATPLAVGPKGNSETLKVRAGLATN